MIPDIVEEKDLPKANSLMNIVPSISSLVGYASGGLIAASFGILYPICLAMTAYTIAAIVFLISRFTSLGRGGYKITNLSAFWGGVKVVWHDRVLGMMTLIALVWTFFYSGVQALLPALVMQVYQQEAGFYGIIKAVMVVGMLVGSLLAGLIAKRNRFAYFLLLPELGAGILIALLSIGLPVSSLGIIFFTIVLFESLADVYAITISQTRAPKEVLGRVFAFFATVSTASQATGALIFGGVATQFGLRVFFLIAGLSISITIFAAFFTRLRSI
jgi:predicted MFS family arabinose efflux permease